jgi:hypothetical protein
MRKWATLLAVLMALAYAAMLPSGAPAGGRQVHEIAGRIADKYLDNKARAAVAELLKGHQFPLLADGRLNSWADAIRSSAAFRRKYPTMAQWHYINIDVSADPDKLDLAKYRQGGETVIDAIHRLRDVLKDKTKPFQDRREALFFICHFIEDLHQPLHCADREGDRGGNLVRVRLPGENGREANLHSVWDTPLVETALGAFTVEDFAGRLTNSLTAEQRKELQQGKIEDWVVEGFRITRVTVYQDQGKALLIDRQARPALSRNYVAEGAAVVEGRLVRAGLRLAQFLNDTFKE